MHLEFGFHGGVFGFVIGSVVLGISTTDGLLELNNESVN